MKLFDNPNDDFSGVFHRKPQQEVVIPNEEYIEEDVGDSQEVVPDEQDESCPIPEVKKVKRGEKLKKSDSEKLTQYRSAKYSDRQIEQLENIKIAMGTTTDGDALRWVLDAAYKANKRKIERIVEEKQRIETL